MTTWLHQQRFEAVLDVVLGSGARRILDLGCGDGDLLVRLAGHPAIEHILGVDVCPLSLRRLSQRLAAGVDGQVATVELLLGSMLEPSPAFAGFDCALMIETIEHIDSDRLSLLETAVLARARPKFAVITTPNAEYNSLLGVPATRFRHPDHRFEWTREKFRRWTEGVSRRSGYVATCTDIAGRHPTLGGASQMAVLRLPA